MRSSASPFASSKTLKNSVENDELKRLYHERVNQQAKKKQQSSPFGELSATEKESYKMMGLLHKQKKSPKETPDDGSDAKPKISLS